MPQEQIPLTQTTSVVAAGLLTAITAFVIANRLVEVRRVTTRNIVLDGLAVGILAGASFAMIRSAQAMVLQGRV